MVVAAASPALSADRLLTASESSLLARDNVGKPYWALLAGCAGFFGGTSNFYTDNNEPAKAEQAKDTGVRFLNEALEQLRIDRGLAPSAGLNALVPTVDRGRIRAKQLLMSAHDDPNSDWNFARSTCMDIQRAYLAKVP